MRTVVRMLCIAPAALVIVACGSSDQPAPGQAARSTPQAEQTFTQTVVMRNADGTEQVHYHQLTAAQERDELQQWLDIRAGKRLPALLTEDTGCSNPNSIWLFDSTTYAQGNQICFYNSGSSPDYASLSGTNYCESFNRMGICTKYWSGQSIGSWLTPKYYSASLTIYTTSACSYDEAVMPCTCFETINFPADESGCNAGATCNNPSPSVASNQNVLWMNNTSAELCTGCGGCPTH